ncbi:VWA domain-containing protein [Candidatus Woesearchaeota archaeon]|nr:VWA domain-containing protein [Candidatus Woesearchaeota archaeon]
MVKGNSPVEVKEFSKAEEIQGKLSFQDLEDKFMHSVLENDKKTIDEGKLISDAINQGMGSFTPDLMFEQLVRNYSIAKQIFGESLIRLVSGYEPDYVKKNAGVPEFQKELRERINRKMQELKQQGLVGKEQEISNKGYELASLVLYFQELDRIIPKGLAGEKLHKETSHYGDKEGYRRFRKGERYRDIAIKRSIKTAIRRSHSRIELDDLHVHEKQSRGQAYIIYALDASGSMKGRKMEACKKAGIALAYKAISEKDKVGLIVFGSEIKTAIGPTSDFTRLIGEITRIRPSKETDIVATFRKSTELFPEGSLTKHLILITDALPTKGKDPENETLEEVSIARNNGITVSVIGINLDPKGNRLAEKIAEIGNGRLYVAKDSENVDEIILEDYYNL